MAELVLADGTGKFFDDPSCQPLVDNVEQTFASRVFRDGVDLIERELSADYGSRGQDLVGALGEFVQPPADYLSHSLRRPHIP